MTSIAFVLGRHAAGRSRPAPAARARNSLGTAVFGGMILSTVLNLFITPVLYVFITGIEDRFGFGRGKHATPPPATPGDGRTAPPPPHQQPARV